MVTAGAMAALSAMALGNCGVSSSNEDSCNNSGGKDNREVAIALVTIALVALAIAHFITCNFVANAITRVLTIAITFVSMQ
jgi:hypothetical protein